MKKVRSILVSALLMLASEWGQALRMEFEH